MYIVAEIGFNHEGDMQRAEQMINAAAGAGADAVKFQTYRARDIALPNAPHYEAVKCGEMNIEEHRFLAQVAAGCNVTFLSTPFSCWAVELLEEVGVSAYKVASMDCTNQHLLGLVAETKKPLYISTGMANLSEIAETLRFLGEKGSGPVHLLHCISKYPAEAEDLNLVIIPLLKNEFGVPIGYSDHYPGIEASVLAAAYGAEIIEKHFTLDTTLPGADHYHSADPQMLRDLKQKTSFIGIARGSRDKVSDRPDRDMKGLYRRGVYAARHIASGERLTEDDLLLSRPESALSPNDLPAIIDRETCCEIEIYRPITREMVK